MDEKRVHPPLFGRKAFPKDCRMVQTHCPGFVLREAHFGLLQNLMRILLIGAAGQIGYSLL